MFRKKVAAAAARGATASLSSAKTKKILAAADAANAAAKSAKAEASLLTPSARPAADRPVGGVSSRTAAVGSTGMSSSALLQTSPPAVEVDGLGTILDSFRGAVSPLTDLDETFTAAPATSASVAPSNRITYRTFAASLTCEKKFFLMQERPDLIPKVSIGEAVHLDDAAGFNELARRWDRLQFGSKAILIADQSFEQAAQHTERVILNYFGTTYASLGEQAPSLTLHRPAFAAPLGPSGPHQGGTLPGEELLLQARPAVLRYRPKDNQWVILEAQAIVDPAATTARTAQCLQRIHFSMLAFRYWVTQPHIPIAVRKRFLSLDLNGMNEENRKGHRLQDSAAVTAPIDLKRSGILHIRQFFPGPVTLMDCPPPRLVKYIQRLALEDLLEADTRNVTKANHGGAVSALDLGHLENLDPAILAKRAELMTATQQAARYLNTRSQRSLKQKDIDGHSLFECQQRLMEALLRYHTTKLVVKARDRKQRDRWMTFSDSTPDGHVRSTYAHLEQRLALGEGGPAPVTGGKAAKKAGGSGKKAGAIDVAAAVAELGETPLIPIVPCFSENVGAHCSRGEVCPFFVEGRCLPQKVSDPLTEMDNHLFTLPSTAVSRKVVWWAEGMRTVRDVLHKYKQGTVKLTAPQLRYAKAVSEGLIAVNPKEIEKFFSRLCYPVFVLDFEAAQFALPPFQKAVAYQSIPFQFSMDVFQEDVLTETPTHYDFLHFGKGHSPNVDPRLPLLEELMRVVRLERGKKRAAMEASGELQRIQQAKEEELAAAQAAATPKRGRKPKKVVKTNTKAGVVVEPLTPCDGCFVAHFASFEKTCLEKLRQLNDALGEEIKDFYFLDTMELIKKGFIHPNACGSNSLKKVLPAMCPDFQYGVFGNEQKSSDEDAVGLAVGGTTAACSSAAAAAAMDEVTGGDESSQKGENAMGVYRLWYHQEGGGTLSDLHKASTVPGSISSPLASNPSTPLVPKDARDKVWSTLRIQLLEYCSLDTKALYEIMREIWKEKELAKDLPSADKTGWVFTKPAMRETSW